MKLIIHNLSSTYTRNLANIDEQSSNWYKPFVWAGDDEIIVLTDTEQKPPDSQPTVVNINSSETEILAQILRACQNTPTELLYFTYTEYVQKIANKLTAHNVKLIGALPLITPGQIRYWNSKIGGRQLLLRQDLAAIHDLLPTAISVFNIDSLYHLIENDSTWLLKSNFGAGGAGIIQFTRNDTDKIKDIDVLLQDSAQEKNKKGLFSSDAFLLEEYIGNIATNLSITADFFVDKQPFCIGAAIAKMANLFSHAGIYWQPNIIPDAQYNRIVDVGILLGNVLYRLGYRGYYNIDFIYTIDGQLVLCEVNIRRSTPLDQLLMLNLILGKDWYSQYYVNFSENTYLDRDKYEQQYNFDGDTGIILLTKHPFIPTEKTPFILVAKSAENIARLQKAITYE